MDWQITRKREWPRQVRYFGHRLQMAKPSLQNAGLELESSRTGRERIVTIRLIGGWDSEPPDLDDTSQPPLPALPEVGGK